MDIETAINSVINFLVLYFIYYYVLRFLQSVFQSSLSCVNKSVSHFIYGLSTPAHELAHLIMSLLCLAKIEKVKLFPSKNETGYVKYRISSSIPFLISIKEFFIGIAPALINIPLFIFIECKFILKCNISEINKILNPTILFSKEGIFTLGLFLILLSGIAPSHADLKGMIKGLILFSAIIFGITYIGVPSVEFDKLNFSSLINVVLYYLEIIVGILIINLIINYRNFFKITELIFKNSIKHTFSKS